MFFAVLFKAKLELKDELKLNKSSDPLPPEIQSWDRVFCIKN